MQMSGFLLFFVIWEKENSFEGFFSRVYCFVYIFLNFVLQTLFTANLLFYLIWLLGLDIRWGVVLGVAGSRRLDVHSIHTQSVRDFVRPICGGYPTRHLSEHNVDETRENAGMRRVGVVIRHLSAAAGRLQQ